MRGVAKSHCKGDHIAKEICTDWEKLLQHLQMVLPVGQDSTVFEWLYLASLL